MAEAFPEHCVLIHTCQPMLEAVATRHDNEVSVLAATAASGMVGGDHHGIERHEPRWQSGAAAYRALMISKTHHQRHTPTTP